MAKRSGGARIVTTVAGGDGKLMAILLDNVLLGMIGESLIKFNVPGADFARDSFERALCLRLHVVML